MLGEKVGSISGPTSMKALSAVNGSPSFETTASGLSGTLAGTEVSSFATYAATMRADGSFYGECPNSGVIMAADGVATFRATGTGAPTADGGFSFRGVAYFEAAAPSLASLNGVAIAYEWDVDANGDASWELWEWK
jgi:hypothetical protein|tara:strand:- start:154 stop:561 length:408 start_codon:yes stop_codon:yes gene_type:complete